MDPQSFIRLSIGSLGLRIPKLPSNSPESRPCSCEIRLRGFPVQTTSVPFLPSPEATPDPNSIASSFYLEDSDVKSLLQPGCFHTTHACLEIVVFTGHKGTHCGVAIKRQQVGTFRLEVGPEWSEGKPALLFNGWIGIGKNKPGAGGKPGVELHLRVKLDPDPRYVFQFEEKTKLSPQIVQLQGTIKQPIFSCKFSQDRVPQVDPLSNFSSGFPHGSNLEMERRERKGWKVKIHDLSGSAVAATFITTPFVPSTGRDWVDRSNPGAWLIVRPDPFTPDSWQPWGKLEAWRERGGIKDSVCCRFHLVSEEGGGGSGVLMSEILVGAEKGMEFCIDTEKRVPKAGGGSGGDMSVPGGFVMRCRVQPEGKCRKLLVQLAMRHVTCVEDAAIFMALAAAVDLSVEACRPFRSRRLGRGPRRHSW
ncbi:hypothetical protein DM860_004424 [Cuscuta australis]|uniref:Uncharacterized protein n=1 Tax=Cuscuta australis TaxID=267555 RepID=A0A328EBJ7_9ASTE|nr:hypothetical protein DM860_004424 [Cuscuta australis]